MRSFGADITSGFVVFLVALPLCLGIALASSAPMASGIISAIIAGLVVSWLSGSELSISGPAAGMAVVVASSIGILGSWSAFLLATIIAGFTQVVLSQVRAGSLAAYFPNSVIKGMLAAIGLTLIFKQFPHALGWDVNFEGDESFSERLGQSNTFMTMLEAVGHHTPAALMVSGVAIAIMFLWNSERVQSVSYLKLIPSSLLAVISGTLVNVALLKMGSDYAMDEASGHLVSLPKISSLSDFSGGLSLPSMAQLALPEVWIAGFTLAAVASLETLLSVEAIDRMDPERRVSNGNRELFAQGVGNILCGIFGGLIMTSVVVRSSANVYAGARSRWSCFFHGVFFVGAVVFGTALLNQIPLAALAVVLIFVGYKLVRPALIRSVWRLGPEQFIPFIITIIAIILTDLLRGVVVGLCVGFVAIIKMNHRFAITVVNDGNLWLIRFAKDVSFAHKGHLKRVLSSIPDQSQVIINGSGADFIDFDILEEIRDFIDHSKRRGIHVVWRNLRSQRFSLTGRGDGHLQEPSFSE
jgi:MFS superfamily sulfate permease-like transporter